MSTAANTSTSATESVLSGHYNEAIRPYIDILDEMRALGVEKDISITQIAVMGDQSSGKSSVLESLCNVPFPRGTGLVTRCAMQIKMTNAPAGTKWSGRISIAWDKPQPQDAGPIDYPADIEARIIAVTSHLLEESMSDFSDKSIVIEIVSSDVPDLTVVDLPGIIRTTTDGQDKGVIDDVNALIDTYLQQPRTIILAVIPANVDIATVDILEKASAVDPGGDRTVGVLTKPDLVDIGTESEVVAVLLNRVKPLKHGYVMVRNRNSEDLKAGISISEAHRKESQYFEEHAAYKSNSPRYFGIKALTEKLTTLLVNRTKVQIPDMTEEVNDLLKKCSTELASMPPAPPESMEAKFVEYQRLCQNFTRTYEGAIKGDYSDLVFNTSDRLMLCAYAKQAFSELLTQLQDSKPAFDDEAFLQQLKKDLRACGGRELPGFLSIHVFTKLMGGYIDLWRNPTLNCLFQISKQCQILCEDLIKARLSQYPVLAAHVTSTVDVCIDDATISARKDLEANLDREITEPYTQNDHFVKLVNGLRSLQFLAGVEDGLCGFDVRHSDIRTVAKRVTEWYMSTVGNSSSEDQAAKDMNIMLQSYWKLAVNNFSDTVPKIVQKSLFDKILERLARSLLCFNPDSMEEFFHIPSDVAMKRRELTERADRLRKASLLLQRM